MPIGLTVRPPQAEDRHAWRRLWNGYCAALGGVVSDEVTEGIWERIFAPHETVGCLLACRSPNDPIGFANYVLHPRTWSLRSVCYLEDMFVIPEARGSGAGRLLIQELVRLGKQEGWRRVYWHTHENNYRARALYDQFAPRTDYIRYDIEL
jgi:GNAT superfamily N-acetyltransferase